MNKANKGFTLIEVLVVIVIIGILATLVTVALGATKVNARDAKRISDIKQMQTALELYYNEESTYPPTSALAVGQALVGTQSGKTFMGKIPAGPNIGETYTYTQINGGTSYILGYVLEKPVNEFAAGAAVAVPGNVNNHCLSCSGKYCGSNGCGGICGTACTGSTPVCKSDYTACVGCNTNSDCSKTPATPYCASNVCSATRPTPCSDTVSAAAECTSSSAYGAICGGGYLICKSDDNECGNINLIAAPSNCTNPTTCNCATDSLTKAWENPNDSVSEAGNYTATDLYIGYNNLNGNASKTAVNYTPSTKYEAAKFCADLVINGFSDWYLPSQAELCTMVRSGNYCGSITSACVVSSGQSSATTALNGCTNDNPLLSGLFGATYWSSTEYSAAIAWSQTAANGTQYNYYSKANTRYVRCVRRF
ncbi:MAG: DUF1566 domain-containing protein [Patescibacteria group bacterium]|nr:DUF1566 domain-containing protein [Patescibacteria group bacterium]